MNHSKTQKRSLLYTPHRLPPLEKLTRNVKEELKLLRSIRKHWYCGGDRALAVAIRLVNDRKIIAVPTDTIYGLAGMAQSDQCIEKIYEIKKRDSSKPLAICLASVDDIKNWAEVDHLPKGLLNKLLPGPRTVILKRKPTLNPNLNPDIDNVGIRVPDSLFIRCIINATRQPLALTSANESNEQSTLEPKEFESLWPQLGGIFYPREKIKENKIRRTGSTIVDLTVKGEFKVVRVGRAVQSTLKCLFKSGLKQNEEDFAEFRARKLALRESAVQ